MCISSRPVPHTEYSWWFTMVINLRSLQWRKRRKGAYEMDEWILFLNICDGHWHAVIQIINQIDKWLKLVDIWHQPLIDIRKECDLEFNETLNQLPFETILTWNISTSATYIRTLMYASLPSYNLSITIIIKFHDIE